MIKVNLEQTEIYLAAKNELEPLPKYLQSKEDLVFYKCPTAKEIAALVKLLEDNPKKFKTICISHTNDKKLLEKFKSVFKIVEAAGGIVFNEKNELLMIYRLGKWDLPKGKLEPGENVETAALREVEEETGIKVNKQGALFHHPETRQLCTYHIYRTKNSDILSLKPTYWYYMQAKGTKKLKPQTNEGIKKAEWVDKQTALKYLKKAYGTIADVVIEAVKKMEKS